MENNPVLLKSSVFGGFKKKDVLSYIFELNETTQEEKQRLAEQLEELVGSRDTLAANALEMEQKIASLQASLDDALERLGEETASHARSRELIDSLAAETSKHESTISQQNAEIARQSDINAQAMEKNRIYEEKRHQVELAASQMADLLGQAKNDATRTVERAKQEAEEIMERAKREAAEMVENAKASLDVHVDKANESVEDAYKKFGAFKAGIENLHRMMLDTTQTISEQMHSFKDSIGDIEKLVPEKLSAESLPSLQYRQEPVAEVPEFPNLSEIFGDSLDAVNTESQTTAAAISAEMESPVTAAASSEVPAEAEAENMTQNILRNYGVRKDDSGFFRLAAD